MIVAGISLLLGACNGRPQASPPAAVFQLVQQDSALAVYRKGSAEPLVVQNAKTGMRPYLHPIMAPDGRGSLTQYSPGHHKHQTGLYWGFTRVNGTGAPPDTLKKWFYRRDKPPHIKAMIGRDFFHFNGPTHWKRLALETGESEGEQVSWKTVYHILDEDGQPIMEETQLWTLSQQGNKLLLDLEWQGKALVDITINAFPYGGMFLRMPWREGIAGQAVNAAGQRNQQAEGQRAEWVDVGMQIDGRDDWGHIAIFDHPQNNGHPLPWRVDG
ncbi:MAG: hypothetical protein D6730_25325, partial [Bacteroidetes bacterium]